MGQRGRRSSDPWVRARRGHSWGWVNAWACARSGGEGTTRLRACTSSGGEGTTDIHAWAWEGAVGMSGVERRMSREAELWCVDAYTMSLRDSRD
jgi:hypothetical protein